jgi:hypothetical protein
LRGSICALLLVGCAWAGTATAQTAVGYAPAFDPRAWKGSQAGAPTEVLTLGTAHLSQMPVKVDPALLSALLDKLAAYRPDIITVENVSGEQCDLLKRYAAGTYTDSFDTWCHSPEAAQKAIGMDGPSATAEAHNLLKAWPAQPSPATRRRLAALFLAMGETPSAVVQWRRLPPEERHAGDGVTDETLKLLDRVGAKPNETYDVAVALAVRLGLERIYLVDDHTSDGAVVDIDEKAYGDAVQAAWKEVEPKPSEESDRMEAKLKTPADVLALYRFMNRPDYQRGQVEGDFGANLRHVSPGLWGRQYVASWEVRNLRMVANIRAAAAAHPGARVLNIVGASHKAYYEAYLDMMHDVKLVDAEAVLK